MRDGNRDHNSDWPDRRLRRAQWSAIVALGSLSLLAGACSNNSANPGVADLGSTTTTAPTSASPTGNSGTSTTGALAYASCMRSHGLSDFPDPNPQSGFDDLPSNIRLNSPQYTAANKVCQPLNGGGRHLSQAQRAEIEAKQLAFAHCMRDHGVPSYPDPTFTANGGEMTISKSRGGALNAASPQFQSAQKACRTGTTGVGS